MALPPFAAITASTLLERLSTKLRSVFVGICAHLIKKAVVRSGTNFGQEGLAPNQRSS